MPHYTGAGNTYFPVATELAQARNDTNVAHFPRTATNNR